MDFGDAMSCYVSVRRPHVDFGDAMSCYVSTDSITRSVMFWICKTELGKPIYAMLTGGGRKEVIRGFW